MASIWFVDEISKKEAKKKKWNETFCLASQYF